MASPVRLYVGNLPYVAQHADVEALFAANDIAIKNVDISIDPFTGRNPSYAFVDVDSAEDADRAMDILQGQMVRGRPVRINPKTEKRAPSARPPTKVYDRGWRPQEVPTTNASREDFAFDRWNRDDAESHRTDSPGEQRRVYVGGLPRIPNQDAVNAEIRHLFRGRNVLAVSKLVSPHHSKHDLPGSHYYCFVDLPSPQEAQGAAQALNGTATPYGGQYQVRIARPRKPTTMQRERPEMPEPSGQTPPRRALAESWRRTG